MVSPVIIFPKSTSHFIRYKDSNLLRQTKFLSSAGVSVLSAANMKNIDVAELT